MSFGEPIDKPQSGDRYKASSINENVKARGLKEDRLRVGCSARLLSSLILWIMVGRGEDFVTWHKIFMVMTIAQDIIKMKTKLWLCLEPGTFT